MHNIREWEQFIGSLCPPQMKMMMQVKPRLAASPRGMAEVRRNLERKFGKYLIISAL